MNTRKNWLLKRKDARKKDKVGQAKGGKVKSPQMRIFRKLQPAKSKKEVVVPASPHLFKWNNK